jgi:CPA1 family monovalent cation:H+ antiporter
VHLRLCLGCGKVACCDSSPAKHASKHFADEGHPVMRSFEPGETWRWCFVDDMVV